MQVLVVLVCFLTVVMSQQSVRTMYKYSSNCTENSNCTAYSTCDKKTKECKCDQGYTYNRTKCTQCPGPGRQCGTCCYPPNRYRCVGDHIKTCVCLSNCNDSFVLAAQVALGTALTIAFLALAALFWKTCSRRNGSNGHLSSLRERQSSLTSIQRFVLQRLRDRPPRYEDNNPIRLEKPPPYQETTTNCHVPDIWGTSPPLYSEAVNTPAGSIFTEENKPVKPVNISTMPDTRTDRASENRLPIQVTVSNCSQSSGADNPGFMLHETRPTRPSETELHM